MLYNDKPEIGLYELSNIYLALITTADEIYINNEIQINTYLPREIYKYIRDNVSYLKDQKLIKYWAWPYKNPSMHNPNLIIFPEKDYFSWLNIINETFLKGNNLVSILNMVTEQYGPYKGHKEERTSKVVSVKKEYMTFAICCSLKVDQILNNYGYNQTKITKTRHNDYSNIKKPLIDKLFSSYNIPSLWPLRGEDVAYLHKKNTDFKHLLDVEILKHENNENIIAETFESIVSELFEILDDRVAGNSKNILASFLMNILGFFFPPASFATNLNDTINEISVRNKFGFVYFMSEIKKLSLKREQNTLI